MSRLLIASKKAILLTFSQGQRRYSSPPISRFPFTSGQKTLESWSYPKEPWSKTHGAAASSDHLPQFKNQERELHEQKVPQMDISSDDEFEELGPSANSPPQTNFRFLRENSRKEEVPSNSRHHKVPFVDTRDHGLSSSHVKSKNEESKERALKTEQVTAGCNTLRTNDKNAPRSCLLRIRINKVDPEMSELAIHRLFSSYGYVSGLVSTNGGAIDVFFQVNGEVEAGGIVNNIDKKFIREVELLQPRTTVNSTCDNSSESHFDKLIGGLRKQLELQLIYLEDLEHLHSAISLLEAHPYPINNNS